MASRKKPSAGFHTPFAGLDDVARRRARDAASAPTPPSRSTPPPAKVTPPATTKVSDDDARTFEQAMRGVTPLSAAERRRRASPLDAPGPKAPRPPARPARHDEADAEAELADLVTGPVAAGASAGAVDKRLARRLRAGDYPIEAELDLHGKTRDEAERALDAFIAEAQAAGRRCVLVIHGRGLNSGGAGPVLGEAVHHHLGAGRAARAVLAHALAPPHAGGDGATLVLLRKKR
jgi:DNA-nicking Smr family endonuclease